MQDCCPNCSVETVWQIGHVGKYMKETRKSCMGMISSQTGHPPNHQGSSSPAMTLMNLPVISNDRSSMNPRHLVALSSTVTGGSFTPIESASTSPISVLTQLSRCLFVTRQDPLLSCLPLVFFWVF